MSKYGTWYLVVMIAGLVGCASSDDLSTSSTEQGVAGTDTLFAGERLFPGQEIGAGNTVLVYQGDNNLVLYQNGSAIWATMASLGAPPDRFEMQTDCNAVVYSAWGASWWSGTNGRGSNCYARVIEGDWFVCSGTTRVFSARGSGSCGAPAPSYVGCYVDAEPRALPAFQGTGFGIQQCINTCGDQNYRFAGSQFYGECWCGNTARYAKVPDSECNTPCNSGGGFCGGVWRNSIYTTGAGDPQCSRSPCVDVQ
jgi:hypothetical protein